MFKTFASRSCGQQGKRTAVPPIWLMRQAGRYLPEYRTIREKCGGFLDLLLHSEIGCRGYLAADPPFLASTPPFYFPDILVVPHAFLGSVWTFEAGEGPRLDAIDGPTAFSRLRAEVDHGALAPVYETIGLVKTQLPADTALLGFCGAPWTVATYMVAGFGASEQIPARLFAYRHPEVFAELIDRLVEASAAYLIRQFEAGVDAVQIFDTWSGVLPPAEFESWCIAPCARIIDAVRNDIPNAKFIDFRAVPEQSSSAMLKKFRSTPSGSIG